MRTYDDLKANPMELFDPTQSLNYNGGFNPQKSSGILLSSG